MIISVYINLLLGFLISFYFYYLQTLLVPFYIYIGQALLTSFCLFFTQKLFVLPFYSKIKYLCLTSYSMLIAKLNLYATKPTIIAIKHEIKLLAIIFSSVNTKFGLMTYKVILTSSPIQQGIIKCLILICFAIFKNGDIVNFYPYILESSGRGMSIEDLLNPISTGGGGSSGNASPGPGMPQNNNIPILATEHKSNNDSEGVKSNSNNENNVASSENNVGSSSGNNEAEASNVANDDWRSGNTEAIKAKGAIVRSKLKELLRSNKLSDNQGKTMNSKDLKNGLTFTQDDRDFVFRQMADLPIGHNAYRRIAHNKAISGQIDKWVLELFEPKNLK
jgi:hypothetical protein